MTPTTCLSNCPTWSHISSVLNHPTARDQAARDHIYRLNKSTGIIQLTVLTWLPALPSLSHGDPRKGSGLDFPLGSVFCHLMRSWCFCCGSAWPVVAPLWDLILPSSWLQRLYHTTASIHILRTMGNENHTVSPSSHLVYFWGALLSKVVEKPPHTSSGRSFPDDPPPAPGSKSVC